MMLHPRHRWHATAAFLFCFLPAICQVVPDSLLSDWNLAGYGGAVPAYPTVVNVVDFGASGNGTTVCNQAVKDALLALGSGNGVVFFPAGTYLLTESIQLPAGKVLRGSGADSSRLLFNLGGSGHLIRVEGAATGTTATLTSTAPARQEYLLTAGAASFTAGDFIRLSLNDSLLVQDNWARGTVGQVVRIARVNGDTLFLSQPLRRRADFALSPVVTRLLPAMGCGIECLGIERQDVTGSQTSNLYFNMAAYCWVKGVRSLKCNFAHLEANACTNLEISECYFAEAFSYGSGGKAYGVSLQMTTGLCLVQNNIFRKLRHAMLLQAGANGNVFAYNYAIEPTRTEFPPNAGADMLLHGNYPYANLFEGNIGQNTGIDNAHGISGPGNTLFRNRSELYGIIMTSASNQQLFAGNEVTNNLFGQYQLAGTGHFQHGNNIKGTILPAGTGSLTDSSLYLAARPVFWGSGTWPSVGPPLSLNSGTIPARTRYLAGSGLCPCQQAPLPVSILWFEAREGSRSTVDLYWVTAAEKDNAYFTVEKSGDGQYFETMTTLRGAGNSAVQMAYRAVDEAPRHGINYYLLQMTGTDGSSTRSPIVSCFVGRQLPVAVFPNPAQNQLRLVCNESVPLRRIRLYNQLGQPVRIPVLPAPDGYTFDVTPLPAGLYWLEVELSDKKITEKVVVGKD